MENVLLSCMMAVNVVSDSVSLNSKPHDLLWLIKNYLQTTAFALLYIHNLVIISYRLPSCTQFAIALHILILIVFFYMRSKNSISFLLECFKRSFATKSRLSSHENTKLSSNNLWSVTSIERERWTEDKSWKNISKIMLKNWTSSKEKQKKK